MVSTEWEKKKEEISDKLWAKGFHRSPFCSSDFVGMLDYFGKDITVFIFDYLREKKEFMASMQSKIISSEMRDKALSHSLNNIRDEWHYLDEDNIKSLA